MVLNTWCKSMSWVCLWKGCSHQKQQHLTHNCTHLYDAFHSSLPLCDSPFLTPAPYPILWSRRLCKCERWEILNALWSVLSKCHISSLSNAESTLEVMKLQNSCRISKQLQKWYEQQEDHLAWETLEGDNRSVNSEEPHGKERFLMHFCWKAA